jgi:hypothetical protein
MLTSGFRLAFTGDRSSRRIRSIKEVAMPIALSRGARTLFRAILASEAVEAPFDELRFYRELARAGLMAASGGEAAYHLTGEGEARRWEFLPHPSGPSAEAWALLRRQAGGERVEACDENRSAFRELAAAGLMMAGHTFAGGDESAYRLTKEGFEWKMDVLKEST